jgi:hypothetical protein
VRKNCCSDREKLLKFEVEGQELAKILRSKEQFIQTVFEKILLFKLVTGKVRKILYYEIYLIIVQNNIHLINIFSRSQSWNRQHHGQTVNPTEKLISINLFKILCVVTWA